MACASLRRRADKAGYRPSRHPEIAHRRPRRRRSAVCYIITRMTDPGTLLSLIRQVRAQRSSQPDALEGERLRLEGSLIDFVEEILGNLDQVFGVQVEGESHCAYELTS
jgi:hypothetical protein